MASIHFEPTPHPKDRLIPRSAPLVAVSRPVSRPVGLLDDSVHVSASQDEQCSGVERLRVNSCQAITQAYARHDRPSVNRQDQLGRSFVVSSACSSSWMHSGSSSTLIHQLGEYTVDVPLGLCTRSAPPPMTLKLPSVSYWLNVPPGGI